MKSVDSSNPIQDNRLIDMFFSSWVLSSNHCKSQLRCWDT